MKKLSFLFMGSFKSSQEFWHITRVLLYVLVTAIWGYFAFFSEINNIYIKVKEYIFKLGESINQIIMDVRNSEIFREISVSKWIFYILVVIFIYMVFRWYRYGPNRSKKGHYIRMFSAIFLIPIVWFLSFYSGVIFISSENFGFGEIIFVILTFIKWILYSFFLSSLLASDKKRRIIFSSKFIQIALLSILMDILCPIVQTVLQNDGIEHIFVYFVGVINLLFSILFYIMVKTYLFDVLTLELVDYGYSTKTNYARNYIEDLRKVLIYPVVIINKENYMTANGVHYRNFEVNFSFLDISKYHIEISTEAYKAEKNTQLKYNIKENCFFLGVPLAMESTRGNHYIDIIIKSEKSIYKVRYCISFRMIEGELLVANEKLYVLNKKIPFKVNSIIGKTAEEFPEQQLVNVGTTEETAFFFYPLLLGSLIVDKMSHFEGSHFDMEKFRKLKYEIDERKKIFQLMKKTNKIDELIQKKKELDKLTQRRIMNPSSNGLSIQRADKNDQRYCLVIDRKFGTGKTTGCILGLSELKVNPLPISIWKDRIEGDYLYRLYTCVDSYRGKGLFCKTHYFISIACIKIIGYFKSMNLILYLLFLFASGTLACTSIISNLKINLSVNHIIPLIMMLIIISILFLPNLLLLRNENKVMSNDFLMYLVVKIVRIKKLAVMFEDVDRMNEDEIVGVVKLVSNLNMWLHKESNINNCRVVLTGDVEKLKKILEINNVNSVPVSEGVYNEFESKIVYSTIANNEVGISNYIEQLRLLIPCVCADHKMNTEILQEEFDKRIDSTSNFRNIREVFRDIITR